jgi:hypothetical protein
VHPWPIAFAGPPGGVEMRSSLSCATAAGVLVVV